MGMKPLPEVKDDEQNMQYVIEHMLGIPSDNIYIVPEASYDELEITT